MRIPGAGGTPGAGLPPPRLGMEAAARVRRRVHMRRVAARWVPIAFVLLAVGLAGFIARPRNEALERFLKVTRVRQPQAEPATPAPEGMVTPEGAVDLSVTEGGADRRIRITKGKEGWRVEEYPPGTRPEPAFPGTGPVSSVAPPTGVRPLGPGS